MYIIIHHMNDIHSSSVLEYNNRWAATVLRKMAQESPVVVLTGARQVGKSTLLARERPFSNWRYLSLDDYDVLGQAEEDPRSLLAGRENIVIDEVQKAPGLLAAVKLEVDSGEKKRKFALSGSANLLLLKSVSESLAGRALTINLMPLAFGEWHGGKAPNTLLRLLDSKLPGEGGGEGIDPYPLIQRGFVPPLIKLPGEESYVRWWDGYVSTYLERDLRLLTQIDSLTDFRKVMELLALRTGQILNQTDIARETRVSQPTVHRYLNVLEASCILYRLPAFTRSRNKRVVKSPKVFWFDPGLAAFLSGHYSAGSLKNSREAGGLFECLVYLHLNVLAGLLTPRARVFYWRTTTGHEVDFVVEQGKTILPIEVKLTEKPSYRDIQNLKLFMQEFHEARCGVLVHAGSEIRALDRNIVAVPWTYLA